MYGGCYKCRERFPRNGIKRPKRYEVNYLPDLPEGQNEDGLEAERKLLVEEMKKRNPSATLIASKMDQTFPLRRREIVEGGPPVKTLKERWPALFTERQVFAEFNRIQPGNLESDFFDALDRYAPRLVTIFKSKKGNVGEKLAEIVQQIDSGDCDSDEAWGLVSVGLLTVVSEDASLSPNHLHLEPVSTAIIVEGVMMKTRMSYSGPDTEADTYEERCHFEQRTENQLYNFTEKMLIRKHSLVHHQLRGHAGIAGVHLSHKQISQLCHDKQKAADAAKAPKMAHRTLK
ncbi:hypothetical protein SKAU_G00097860 [Synaphobranchus kaupii]|uniref:Uncharacterized protein n=1 Tax=Synaphobranchus kaupii TaxID=118154 RepID=A0A9Q1FXS7_SYNKA|nr:hypothetical protein SKAU_G00097860 [Synaphobranchus kaupii]